MKRKKNEELIVYVDDPLEQLDQAIKMVMEWATSYGDFLNHLSRFNQVVTKNDLP